MLEGELKKTNKKNAILIPMVRYKNNMCCYPIFVLLSLTIVVTFAQTGGFSSLGTKWATTGCHWPSQNNIEITEVICPKPNVGCLITVPSSKNDRTALPQTEIRYKCTNSEPPVDADMTTTCQGDRWLPVISQCDQGIAIRKSNVNWDGHDIWAPPVFTPECGKSTLKSDLATPLVWRGNVVKPREFPWHAGVYEYEGEESRKPICGASIIASRYLLSAAHCFADKSNPAKLRDFVDDFIMVGKLQPQYNVRENHQQRHDILYVISPSYRGSVYRYQNDVAIIKIKNEITFNSNVSPICLINDYFPYIPENADLWVAGWGVFNGSRVQSEDLMSIKLPFISYDKCSSNLNYKHLSTFLTTEKFCTIGEKGKEMSLDEGDSGGGLVTKGPNNSYYLIGIVSLSVKGSPAVMCTYVPHFHKWIYERTLDTQNKLISGKEPNTAKTVPLAPRQQLESAAPLIQRATSDSIGTVPLQQPESNAPAMQHVNGYLIESSPSLQPESNAPSMQRVNNYPTETLLRQQPESNTQSMQRVNGYLIETLPSLQPESNVPPMERVIGYSETVSRQQPESNAPSMQHVNGYSIETLPRIQPESTAPSMQHVNGYSIDTLPHQQPEPNAPSMQRVNGYSIDTLPRQQPEPNAPSMQRVNGYSIDTLPHQQPESNAPAMQRVIGYPTETLPSQQQSMSVPPPIQRAIDEFLLKNRIPGVTCTHRKTQKVVGNGVITQYDYLCGGQVVQT